jgi:hypothetical protein
MGVDFQERVNFDRLRKERFERTRKKMKENGIDTLLLFNGDNIRYATGTFDYIWRTFMRYAIVPAASDPIVFEPVGPDTEHVLMNNPWLKGRVRPSMVWAGAWSAEEQMADKFARGVKEALKEEGVLSGRIGGDMLDGPSAKALAKAGVQTVDASKAMMEARLIKTRDELEILKQVCFMVDCSYDLLRNQWTKPGGQGVGTRRKDCPLSVQQRLRPVRWECLLGCQQQPVLQRRAYGQAGEARRDGNHRHRLPVPGVLVGLRQVLGSRRQAD